MNDNFVHYNFNVDTNLVFIVLFVVKFLPLFYVGLFGEDGVAHYGLFNQFVH